MYKLLSIVAAVAALSAAQELNATILYPNGVTSGVTHADLESQGWSVLYNVSYGTATTSSDVSSWRTTAGTEQVFVGAFDAQGNLIVGATGAANEVLSQTSSSSTASAYPSSGLYWYNVPGSSFGFTPTSNISLVPADSTGVFTPDDGMNSLRLSWHLDIGEGGWRAGDLTWLNDAPTPNKVVLVSSAVPEPSTYIAGAFMLIPLAAAGLRRIRSKS